MKLAFTRTYQGPCEVKKPFSPIAAHQRLSERPGFHAEKRNFSLIYNVLPSSFSPRTNRDWTLSSTPTKAHDQNLGHVRCTEIEELSVFYVDSEWIRHWTRTHARRRVAEAVAVETTADLQLLVSYPLKSFSSLNLIEPLQRAISAENYETPTPIQAQAIPPLLKGRDVLGCAQTGTGKTAAFLLPIIQHLATNERHGRPVIRAIVLTPTRELAAQIADNFAAYSQFLKLRHLVVFGGVNQRPQVSALQRGVDVLIATPGRLLDLENQGFVDLSSIEFFVLDEADRMLDMGFIRDIRKVLAMLPKKRQSLLFSATMPKSILSLANSLLIDPVRVEVNPESTTVERILQSVMFVAKEDKKRLLREHVDSPDVESAIVFTRTKHGANRVVKELGREGIEAAAIHGNKSQGARIRALEGFKRGDIRILVATDIASRGIDVDGVSHIFNYDLPNIPESYVHRIGRTARAGRDGIAIAFCDESETLFLWEIEKITGKPLDRVLDHPWHNPASMPPADGRKPPAPPKVAKGNSGGGHGRGGRSGGGRSAPRSSGGNRSQGRDPRQRSSERDAPSRAGGEDNRPRSTSGPVRPKSPSSGNSGNVQGHGDSSRGGGRNNENRNDRDDGGTARPSRRRGPMKPRSPGSGNRS